jgi:hypothetical protein
MKVKAKCYGTKIDLEELINTLERNGFVVVTTSDFIDVGNGTDEKFIYFTVVGGAQ